MRIFLLIGVMTWHLGIFNVMADSMLQEAIKSVNDFSKLHVKYITDRVPTNWACSPLGAFISLSMAVYAVRGQTQDQFRLMMDLPLDDKLAKASIDSLVKNFTKSEESTFRSATQIFISENYETLTAFDEANKEIFGSEPRKIDLNDFENVAKDMHIWYMEVTDWLISSPDCSSMVGSRFGAVLVNVAWIEGEWLHKFNDELTKFSTFHLNSHSDTEVPTMFQTNKFKFGEIPGVDAMFLELPYKVKGEDNAASMVILRPNDIDGLADMERNLENVDFDELLRAEPRKVEVGLLKFSITITHQYTVAYHKALLEDTLTPKPKFDTTTDKIHVMGVQTTSFKVDENGSGALFPTDSGSSKDPDLEPVEDQFIVDRPFIAMVVKSGVKLIYSKILDPSQS